MKNGDFIGINGDEKWWFQSMGDLQDPKMEVLYHIKPYFMGIFPEI
jgi:hypothetical protein